MHKMPKSACRSVMKPDFAGQYTRLGGNFRKVPVLWTAKLRTYEAEATLTRLEGSPPAPSVSLTTPHVNLYLSFQYAELVSRRGDNCTVIVFRMSAARLFADQQKPYGLKSSVAERKRQIWRLSIRIKRLRLLYEKRMLFTFEERACEADASAP